MPETQGSELETLAQEIALLREQLRVAASALLRIEKRVKLVFPQYESRREQKRRGPPPPPSTKSREELLAIFEDLLASTRSGGDRAFAEKCQSLPEQDLVALAYELGVSDRKQVSLAKARTGIRGRVQESLLLSGNVSS